MTRLQKAVFALLVCAPAIVMAGMGAVHLRGEVRRVLRNSEVILADEISRQLGREVRIRRAELTPLGRLVLEGVEVAQGRSLKHGPLASVRRLSLEYDYAAVFLQGAGASGIRNVNVTGPRVWLTRFADGSLNISDLLKPPPGPPAPPFAGKVKAADAEIVFRDYYPKGATLPYVTVLRHVSLALSAREVPRYSFDVYAQGPAGRFNRARVSGIYESDRDTLYVDAALRGVDAAFAADSLRLNKDVKLTSGSADISASAALRMGPNPQVLSALGAASLDGVGVSSTALREPVRNLSGTVVLAGQTGYARLSGDIAGARVQASGKITGFAAPSLDIDLSAGNIGLDRFARAIGIPLRAAGIIVPRISTATARVTGAAISPDVEIAATAPRGSFHGYRLADIRARLAYSGGRLAVRSADMDYGGARVRLRGDIGTSGRQGLSIYGSVRRLNLGALPMPQELPVSGTADADFEVTGTTADPKVVVRAAAENIRVKGRLIESISGTAGISRQGVKLEGFRADGVASGTVIASGTYNYREMNLRVACSAIRLANVGTVFNVPWINGTAYLQGSVSGTPGNPFLRADMEVYRPRYKQYEADYARASFGTDRHSATIASATVNLFPAEVSFSGKVSGLDTDRLVFETSGRVDRLSLDRLFETIGARIEASGTIGGEFSAAGTYNLAVREGDFPLSDTVASASINLKDGTAFGYPVDDADGLLTYADNRLTMSEMVIVSEGARLTMGGSLLPDRRELDVDFSLTGFDLARVRRHFSEYVTASGAVDVAGSVEGNWSRPRVNISADLHNLIVNRVRFDRAAGAAVYEGSVVSSGHAELAKGTQQFRFDVAGLDIAQRHLASGTAQAANADLAELWEAFRTSPLLRSEKAAMLRRAAESLSRPKSGTFNAVASLSGPLSRPDGVLSAHGENIVLDIHKIESLDIAAKTKEGVIELEQFNAKSGDAYLSATGSPLYDKGNLQLSASLGNIDLGRFNYQIGKSTAKGNLSIELEASGKAAAPEMTLSAEVISPSVNGYTFDRLRASRIDVANGRISVPDPDSGIILAVGSHQIVAHGSVPWDWSTISVPRDEPIELSVGLKNEDLSILSSLAPLVDSQATKGPVDAQLTLSGTLNAPKANGLLDVSNGTIALKGFASVLEQVNADVVFDGDRILINNLSAKSSLGGAAQVRPGGSVTVTGNERPVDLLFVSDGLRLTQQNVFGINELVSLRIDAGIAVGGSLDSPVITDAAATAADGGNVTPGIVISDALIRFAIPEKPAGVGQLELPFNPRFGLGVRIGDNVRLQPPSMDVVIAGGGKLAGEYGNPANPMDLNLDISARRGSLYLANTRLTISPESSVSVRYIPPAEPRINLKRFAATAFVTATNELGTQERYQITVEASGPVTNMQLNMTSNPPGLSRQKILMALGHMEGVFDSGERGLQEDIASAITAVGSSALFRPIERVFTERLGFEQFSLEYSSASPLSLFLSTKLSDTLDFSYYRRLQSSITKQSQSAFQAKIGWRFQKNYRLSLGIDDQEVVTGQIDVTRSFR